MLGLIPKNVQFIKHAPDYMPSQAGRYPDIDLSCADRSSMEPRELGERYGIRMVAPLIRSADDRRCVFMQGVNVWLSGDVVPCLRMEPDGSPWPIRSLAMSDPRRFSISGTHQNTGNSGVKFCPGTTRKFVGDATSAMGELLSSAVISSLDSLPRKLTYLTGSRSGKGMGDDLINRGNMTRRLTCVIKDEQKYNVRSDLYHSGPHGI